MWSYSSVIFQSKIAIPQLNSGFSNTGDKQKVISASFFLVSLSTVLDLEAWTEIYWVTERDERNVRKILPCTCRNLLIWYDPLHPEEHCLVLGLCRLCLFRVESSEQYKFQQHKTWNWKGENHINRDCTHSKCKEKDLLLKQELTASFSLWTGYWKAATFICKDIELI